MTSPAAPKTKIRAASEHPAAKRMREEFEAKFGSLAPVVSAMNSWFNVREGWNDHWNRDREVPVTEDDVETAQERVFEVVRAYAAEAVRTAAPPELPPLGHAETAMAAAGFDFPPMGTTLVQQLVQGYPVGTSPEFLEYLWQCGLAGWRAAEAVRAPPELPKPV